MIFTARPHFRRRFFPRRRRGVLLFVVTIVLAALTLGGMSLLTLMNVERESTRLRSRELDLTNVGRSAVVLIQALGEMSKEERDRIGGISDNPNLFCRRSVLDVTEGGDGSAFTILSPRLEEGRTGVRYGLVNESTRLNLGSVLAWDRENPGTGRDILMKLPGMTAVMADSLLDWIDSDEIPRSDGAEGDYYRARRLTYSPRNALPISLDELLLVRGITRYQLYGTDVDFNYDEVTFDEGASRRWRSESRPIGSLQTDERNAVGMTGRVIDATDAADARLNVTIPWSRLLTVFSAERDVDPNGRPRIDLNEKRLDFLFDELTAHVGEEIAVFVILCRQFGMGALPTGNPPGASRENGGTERDATLKKERIDFARPARFNFRTPLDIVGAIVRIPASPDHPEEIIPSPLSDRRQNTTALFAYLDYASVGPTAVLTGRVNVNESPRTVLEMIPDLTEEIVTRIVSGRSAPGRPVAANRRHAAWLYAEGIVDLAAMKRLWPKLTTGGDVFRAQIVAFSETFGAVRRGEAVIDATVSPPRQVFYKDLTMYGRGFSPAVLMNRPREDRNLGGDLNRLLDHQMTDGSPYGAMENAPLSGDPFAAVEGKIGGLGSGDVNGNNDGVYLGGGGGVLNNGRDDGLFPDNSSFGRPSFGGSSFDNGGVEGFNKNIGGLSGDGGGP